MIALVVNEFSTLDDSLRSCRLATRYVLAVLLACTLCLFTSKWTQMMSLN